MPQMLPRPLAKWCSKAQRRLSPYIVPQPRCIPTITRRHKSGPYGYTQAKALVYSEYGEPAERLSLHTHSISPSLPPNTLLLRTLAAPINPADINQIQGVYPSKPPLTSLLGTALPSAIGGNEGCFSIEAIGPSTPPIYKKGDIVIPSHTNLGTWRTHALVQTTDVIKIRNPDGLTPTQMATVSVNPCTAYRMLQDFVPLQPGDWFMQNAANSGVGRAAIQIGALRGLHSLNVVRERATEAATEALKAELRGLGATQVVTETEVLAREFRDRVASWTTNGKDGIKLALNCVGGKATAAMIKSVARGGTVVTYGGMARTPLTVPVGQLIFNDIKYVGFWVSRWSDQNPKAKSDMVEEILGWLRDGKMKEGPSEKLRWEWDTKGDELKSAIQQGLEGFRQGKGLFIFEQT